MTGWGKGRMLIYSIADEQEVRKEKEEHAETAHNLRREMNDTVFTKKTITRRI